MSYVVTAHQPNYIPGLSVIEKVKSADAVIWLDEVRYSPHGWTNRNRMPDGSWLTVPVMSGAMHRPLNRVHISNHRDWRKDHCKTLRQHYGSAVDEICEEIQRPLGLLVGLNLACLRIILADCDTSPHYQCHLDGGRAVTAISDEREELAPISVRLAMMVAELGGTTYLSGPSGRNYLDERPFHDLGIEVEYWKHEGANPCALASLHLQTLGSS
jgi:hypothetical protein